MKHQLLAIVIGTVGMVLAVGSAANATVIVDVRQVGGDVVFTTTGSLDLTGATAISLSSSSYNDGFIPGGSNWYIASGAGSTVDFYALSTADGAFGTSTAFFSNVATTIVSGDDFLIWGHQGLVPLVGVPVGYISNSAINSMMIFPRASLTFFTVIPGTYGYTLPSDNIVLNVGPVPEPTTALLLGFGLLGMGIRRRAVANSI